MSPELSLSVQYGTDAPELPRWRLRGWVRSSLAVLAAETAAAGKAPLSTFGPAALPERLAITLRLTDADEGQALNTAWRGHDYATNVLTFEYGTDPEGTAQADIVLCVPVLHREAIEQGKPLLDHAAHLVVHGTLHALGFDHIESDQADEMEALETRILARLRIPDPYSS